MKYFSIAALPGDGIGPEVTRESIKILKSLGDKFDIKFDIKEYLVGGIAIDIKGESLPTDTLEGVKDSQAILFGAIGGPKWDGKSQIDTPEKGLLKLRKELGVYANLRPVFVFDELLDASPIKPETIKGVDLIVVRELISGIYFGRPRGIENRNGEKVAFNTMIYTESEIRAIASTAFNIAMNRNKKVCMVDKANVLEVSKLWREVVSDVSRDFKDIELSFQYVDNASMQLIRNPRSFDVILTSNLFGDILSDEASQLSGSIGLLPSASIGKKYALYEPIHGSAPDIAGEDIANPIASILSVAMMFEYSFNELKIANIIRQCVKKALSDGYRTKDIFVDSKRNKCVGCTEMGNMITNNILDFKD